MGRRGKGVWEQGYDAVFRVKRVVWCEYGANIIMLRPILCLILILRFITGTYFIILGIRI